MEFHQISILHDIASFHPLPFKFGLSPDSGEFETMGNVLVYCDGHIHDGASTFEDKRCGVLLKLLPGSLGIDADNFQDIKQTLPELGQTIVGYLNQRQSIREQNERGQEKRASHEKIRTVQVLKIRI